MGNGLQLCLATRWASRFLFLSRAFPTTYQRELHHDQ